MPLHVQDRSPADLVRVVRGADDRDRCRVERGVQVIRVRHGAVLVLIDAGKPNDILASASAARGGVSLRHAATIGARDRTMKKSP